MPTLTKTSSSVLVTSDYKFNHNTAGNESYVLGTTKYIALRSYTGETNVGYRHKIRRASSATTSFTAVKDTIRPSNIYLEGAMHTNMSGLKAWSYGSGDLLSLGTRPADPTGVSSVTADNLAMKKFVRRADGLSRSMQGLTFVGELAEALHMIRHPAKSLRSSLDDYLKLVKKQAHKASRRSVKKTAGRGRRRKNITHAIADTWLEWSFGAAPLLNDVDDAMKALANLRYAELPPRQTISASGHVESISDSTGPGVVLGTCTLTSTKRKITSVDVKYLGCIKLDAPNGPSVIKQFGLAPKDVLPTIWELIPWSFAVDYFTNVGDIIDGYSFNRTSVAWAVKMVKRSNRTEIINDHVTPFSGVGVTVDSIYYRRGRLPSWTRQTYQRDAYGGDFTPSFQFEIPGLGTKWINLSALSLNSRAASKAIRSYL